MSRYRGRRAHRDRGVSPITFLIAALVVVAAVILLIVTLKQDKKDKPEPNTPMVEDNTPTVPEDSDPVVPAAPTIERIEVFGDTQQYEGVYRVGDTGYEMYTYVDSTAQKYAACVNQAADALKGTARVFAMPIPLSSGITLPDDLYSMNVFSDQKTAENSILSYMGENVIGISLYDTLMQHRTEYLYYRADHHWTGLGAYYAYTQYCAAAGLTAHALTDYQTAEFSGYLGSFYNDSGKNSQMEANPDVVTAYYPMGSAVLSYTDRNGNVYEGLGVICDETSAPAAFKYGAYIYGDNPYTVIKNSSITDGSACVVVKESFGNAYVPFMVDHYQTVYVIDYRYWSGSLTEFVKSNGVDDVLFCNNLSAIRNNSLMGNLYSIL